MKKEGGIKMIEKLYDTHYKELLGWCQSMTQDLQQAEDLVQEAFLRAMKHTEVLKYMKEKQRVAWLYRTIKNLYIDKIRHASFETVMEEIPESAVKLDEFFRFSYEQAILQLPKEEQELFIMQYQGYNSTELAQIFGIPSGTVRAKLFSARKKLKEILRE